MFKFRDSLVLGSSLLSFLPYEGYTNKSEGLV